MSDQQLSIDEKMRRRLEALNRGPLPVTSIQPSRPNRSAGDSNPQPPALPGVLQNPDNRHFVAPPLTPGRAGGYQRAQSPDGLITKAVPTPSRSIGRLLTKPVETATLVTSSRPTPGLLHSGDVVETPVG